MLGILLIPDLQKELAEYLFNDEILHKAEREIEIKVLDKAFWKNRRNTLIKFEKIATGSDHSLALTKSGKLYSWGDNGSSQLGLG
jgi:alpha-tubulin suppressor-like RCC1 family protein